MEPAGLPGSPLPLRKWRSGWGSTLLVGGGGGRGLDFLLGRVIGLTAFQFGILL